MTDGDEPAKALETKKNVWRFQSRVSIGGCMQVASELHRSLHCRVRLEGGGTLRRAVKTTRETKNPVARLLFPRTA